VSRSESKPVSASLHKIEGTTNLPDKVKSAMSGVNKTSINTRTVSRGGSGQRAETDRSRNLGDPAGCWKQQRSGGTNNSANGPGWESDRSTVAKKRVMTVER
jgi:hypothetical protein